MYNVCGLGGVETSIINRVGVFRRLGLETRILFQDYWGEGGKLMAQHPAISICKDEDSQRVVIDELSPDCIVVVDSPRFVRVVKRSQARCPLLFETHMSDLNAFEARRVVDAIADSRVSLVVAPAEFNRSVLIGHSIDESRIRIIPNSIDLERFETPADEQRSVHLNVPIETPLLLFVGRLEPQKNAVEFVRIHKKLLEYDRSIHAVIVGDAVDTQSYEQAVRAEAAPIIENVTFLPRVSYDEMPALYQAVARSGGCLVSTSLHESQPMIILEAMASRCPVVASNVGGTGELVRQGKTGHVYQSGDTDRAARHIWQVTADRRLRSTTVRAAQAYVRSRHSCSWTAESYRKLFQDVGVFEHA